MNNSLESVSNCKDYRDITQSEYGDKLYPININFYYPREPSTHDQADV